MYRVLGHYFKSLGLAFLVDRVSRISGAIFINFQQLLQCYSSTGVPLLFCCLLLSRTYHMQACYRILKNVIDNLLLYWTASDS